MKSRSAFTVLLIMLVSSTLFSGCGEENDGDHVGIADEPTDETTTYAIENQARLTPNLMDDMQISTLDGVVTLTGTVPNLLAEREVLRIARSTRGVRSVIDELSVVPEERSDAAIAADVRKALSSDVATSTYDLDEQVHQGVVRLTGTVNSWAERWLASDVVRGVRGVVGIEDYTDVTGKARTDEQIREDLESRLRNDAWVDDILIDVEVHDGSVTLSGAVGSAEEKMLAANDALLVGAKDVDVDQLDVEWTVRDASQQAEGQIELPDSAIHNAVMDAIALDPRVQPSRLEVSMDNGVVTLTGKVRDLRTRSSLVEDATNTLGVLGVIDSLEVTGPDITPEDRVIEAGVKQALERDPYVGKSDIDVTVSDGVVSLAGTVDLQYQKLHAQRLVEKLSDLKAVENDIHVDTDAAPRTDQEILGTLEQDLHWVPWLSDADVEVSVEDGVATIRGSVNGWFERNLLQELAKDAGAEGVLTELNVAVRHASVQ